MIHNSKMNNKKYLSLIWVGVLFTFFPPQKSFGQNEWLIKDYPGKEVRLLAETYDGGIIVQVLPWSYTDPAFNKPVYLVKYSMEGKKIWEKALSNNVFAIRGACSTQDSGFIVSAIIYLQTVDSASVDTSENTAILKFDKCGHLQWARHINSVSQGWGNQPFSVIESAGDFYICTDGINGYNNYYDKRITVLKFSQSGELLKYHSFIGDDAELYKNPNEDTIYLAQGLYAPLGTDKTIVYLFSGIQSMDTSLNELNNIVVGYQDKAFNARGSMIVKNNEIIQISQAYLNSGIHQPMFTILNKDLSQRENFHYDSIKHFENMYPAYANFRHDSLVVCSEISPQNRDTNFASLRLYNKNLHVIKETLINKTWYQNTTSFLALKNGQYIVAELYYDTHTLENINTGFLLYDNALNPIPWPKTPPAKGYDWACHSNIPDSESIYVDSVVTPVYVAVDTSKINWHPLGIHIPQNVIQGRSENGWVTWPQPVSIGAPLYLKSLSNGPIQNYQRLDVLFYDNQGKQVYGTTAIYLGNNQWAIQSLNISNPGVYLAELRNNRTGASLGKIKVVVE